MKFRVKLRILLLASMVAALAVPVAVVGAQPEPPMSLSGYVFVDGSRASDGTLIEAKRGGSVVDSCNTVTAGGDAGYYALEFSEGSGDVSLFVGGVEANESPIPYSMGWQDLDLHVGAPAGATVSILAPSEVLAGSGFTARVSISGVENLNACNYDVTYDADVVEVTDVTSGQVNGTTMPVNSWGLIPPGVEGTVRVIQHLPGITTVSGDGYLADIHFDVVGSECNTSELDLNNGVLINDLAEEIPATWVDDSVHVCAAPVADFAASPTSGTAPLTVDFTDQSTGTVSSWDWSFGDGDSSTDQDPSHTYTEAGTYTVSLTASGPCGSDTETRTGYVSVSAFEGVTLTVDAPAQVQQGSSFVARVNVSEVEDFDACDFHLTYDPDVIEVTDVTDGLIDGTTVPVDNWGFIPAGVQGTVRVIENLPGVTGASGEGYLAEVHFDVVGDVGDTSDLDLHDATLSDVEAESIPVQLVDDAVEVIGVVISIDAPAEVEEDEAFMAWVNISRIEDFDACDYYISYDPDVIEVTDVTDGEINGTDIPLDTWGFIPAGEQGTIRVIQNVPGVDGASGSGYLAKVHFEAVGDAGDSSVIDLEDATVSDTEAQEIPVTLQDDTVSIVAPPVPPEEEVEKEKAVPGLPAEGPDMSLSNLFISHEEAAPRQVVEVSVNVNNNGGQKGARVVTLYINGHVEQSESVAVSPGSSQLAVFRVAKTVPGQYQVSVDGLTGQFTVLAPGFDSEGKVTTVATGAGGLGTAGIIVIVVVALVLAGAIVFLFRTQ